jgi:tetratricopeptide (TPR) repeat protein
VTTPQQTPTVLPELTSSFHQALELHQAGRLEEASEVYLRILKAYPNHFDSLHLLGVIYSQQGNHAEAVRQIDASLKVNPKVHFAYSNLGNSLRGLKRFDEALANYDKALALKPDNAEAFNNRGNALLELKRFVEALASYDKAVALKTDYAEAFNNRSHALLCLKQAKDALGSSDKALELNPNFAEAFNNRGNALLQLARLGEALASYDKALALKPDYAEAFNNRGNALRELKQLDQALVNYERALTLKPDYAEARLNEALVRLLIGDLEGGWPEYECRWKSESLAFFSQPLWLGADPIDGKTILLHSEQGFGDTIQFCRYVPLVAARGAHVILAVQPPLQELMTTLAGAIRVTSKADPIPDFDVQCPLLSLPLAFGTRLETIPAEVPYLHAPAQSLKNWQQRLALKAGPKIGLAWSGSLIHKNDQNRSMSLQSLLPLLDIEATFVSLQKDVRSNDFAVLKERADILDFGDELKDFSDTAGLISQLDLVISVDTSVAHLAGALGKPVWILLPFVPDWRWLLDRDDSPWYPNARLFRQNDIHDWDGVIRRIDAALRVFVGNQKQELRQLDKQKQPDLSQILQQAASYHQKGNLVEAERLYLKILTTAPDHFDAQHLLAGLCYQKGRFNEALELIGAALRTNPNVSPVISNYGTMLSELNRLDEAIEAFDSALKIDPENAETHYCRATILNKLKRHKEALEGFDHALTFRPHYAEALYNRGNALKELGRYDDALESYDRALAVRPDYAKAFFNRGVTLRELKLLDEALVSFDKALTLKPDYPEAFNNKGAVLQDLRRIDDALASYDGALDVRPNYAEAHWNRALARLLNGDLDGGWPEYEWRWKSESLAFSAPNFSQPLWLGADPIDGKTILLHSEQGFGDTIQFCRYVPLVAARGARVILAVQPSLQELMTTLAGALRITSKADPIPDFDLECPLLSLPLAFGTRLETIPAEVPYLHAPAQSLKNWQQRLAPKARPRIGLAWSGSLIHKNDQNRSMSLQSLLPLLDIEATFVSLQKDVRSNDLAMLKERADILDFGDELKDFSDTAGLISQLDLVISVDTSVAHLAGALGKPVWILLPFVPDWRWLLDRDDSPWYPNARLFRQDDSHSWDNVVERVHEALLKKQS